MVLSRAENLQQPDEETMDTKEMDYSELLFAYHVRELAMKRLVHETPEGLTAEAATQYMFERFEPTVLGVVRELQNVATMIRNAGPGTAA
ncbi:hypothetical protein JN27_15010 [Massilia sp. BSC265]|nr:hypothetical protein JN27_15010 [Massilia sp. BSC265]